MINKIKILLAFLFFALPISVQAARITQGNIGGGAASTPGGADTNVQFNDSGSFGGESDLTYDKTTNTLGVENVSSTGTFTVTDLSITDGAFDGITSSTITVSSATVTDISGDLLNYSSGTISEIIGSTGTFDVIAFDGVAKITIGETISISTPAYFHDGQASNPSISFNNDTDTGFYRSATNNINIVSGGSSKITIGGNVVISTPTYFHSGQASYPGISFNDDVNSGLYSVSADTLGISVGGVQVIQAASSNVLISIHTTGGIVQFLNTGIRQIIDGTVSDPSIHWSGDTDTGLYNVSDGNLGIACNGGLSTQFSANQALFSVGSAAAPSLSFQGGQEDTGMFWSSADVIGFATNGTHRMSIANKSLSSGATDFQILMRAGTAAAPIYSFNESGRTDDGLYSAGAGAVGISASGNENLRVDGSATSSHTRLLLWDVDNATLERVTVGAADSGGSGFKVLRIPN